LRRALVSLPVTNMARTVRERLDQVVYYNSVSRTTSGDPNMPCMFLDHVPLDTISLPQIAPPCESPKHPEQA
jgi:hypothetical protein